MALKGHGKKKLPLLFLQLPSWPTLISGPFKAEENATEEMMIQTQVLTATNITQWDPKQQILSILFARCSL